MTETRACSWCGEVKPYNGEHFKKNMHGRLQAFCRPCATKASSQRRRDRKAGIPPKKRGRVHKIVDGKRLCTVCKEWKGLEHFYSFMHKGERLRYTPRCKICHNAGQRRSYYDNHQIRLVKSRIYGQMYRDSGRSRITQLAWRKKNIELARQYCRERRGKRLEAPGNHTLDDVIKQLEKQRGACYWCDKKIEGTRYHVDHIIPLSKGGSDGPENIACTCPRCNLSKSDKMPWEFAPHKFLRPSL